MCSINSLYAGTTAEQKPVSGTITIPEVAHDTDEDEYVVCSLALLRLDLQLLISDVAPYSLRLTSTMTTAQSSR